MSIPKYIFIKEHLKMKLIKGEIAFGEKLPSEHDLMEQFSVSRYTIRQALSELENDGVISKMQGKGAFSTYVKSDIKSEVVAVVTTYISDYIFPSIMNGIEDVLSKQGYPILLYSSHALIEKERQCLSSLMNQKVSGLIIDPTQTMVGNMALFEKLSCNIKTVFMNANYKIDNSSNVEVDDYAGVCEAVTYLIQNGHTDFAGIFKTDDLQGIRRKNGFIDTLEKYNISIDSDNIGDFTSLTKYEFPYEFAKKCFVKSKRPTAVLCYNDEVAAMIISQAKRMDIDVPNDVSVVGFDDSNLAKTNGITTISHPKKSMGELSAKFLIDMIENDGCGMTKVYKPELVVRTSTRSLL